MNALDADLALREAVARTTVMLARRGMMPATSGNVSARRADGTLWVTASGRDKTQVAAEDVVAVDPEGVPCDAAAPRPSAEGRLHAQVLRELPSVGAVAHVHTVAATVVSMRCHADTLLLRGYELAKAFSGITTHEVELAIPVVPNSQDMGDIERAVRPRLLSATTPVAYLIRGHGAYVWGRTLGDVERHVEALEFLLTCALHQP